MTTLLQHAKNIADEIGVIRPTTLVGSSDLTARRLLAVAKAAGQALYRVHDWAVLHREHDFTTTASTANYAVPDDWGRPLGNTAWDRTNFRRMRGGKTPREWQFLKSSLTDTPQLRKQYRLLVGPQAGSILIDPTPASTGEELVIEYVSRFWCEDSGGDGQATFAADTDVVRIDEEVFRLGFLWRAKRSLNPPYMDERHDYEVALRDAIKADVNMDITHQVSRPMPVANLPESDFPSS